MDLGIISDTHGLFDPKIATLFAGVAHILHAGDIGSPRVIDQLETIAPVTAVLGNTDDPGLWFKPTEVLEFAGRKFLLHHIVQPLALTETFRSLLARERPDVVVFGHSHKPFSETIDGVLFFNPGYAGKPRFALKRTVAILHCSPAAIQPEHFPL